MGSFQNKFGVDFVVLKTGPDLVKTRVGKRWLPKYSTVSKPDSGVVFPCFFGVHVCCDKNGFPIQRKSRLCVSRLCVCLLWILCPRERSDEDAARKKDVAHSVMTNIAPCSIAVPLLFHEIFSMEFLQRRSIGFRDGAHGLAKTPRLPH